MKFIPYGHQWIDKDDIKSVHKVLQSDWITQGPAVEKFEKALCSYTGAKYAVAVSNGTAALHIACLAGEIKKSDEVITSPITFLASANSVLYCGGEPVFADVQKETGNICPIDAAKRITKKTKALIPVHYAGHPCDMLEINKIAKKNRLLIIEDAAHALGSKYRGFKTGSCKYSDMTILSFHPVKHITSGEGGAILTNNKDFYEKLLIFRNHGINKKKNKGKSHGDWYYEMQMLGYNYRITDIQCALGLSQLKKSNKFLLRRRKIVNLYNLAFKNNSYFDTPIEKNNIYSSYHLYPIRLKKNYLKHKKNIFSKLRKAQIGVQVHYMPVYLHPYYKALGYKKNICPQAEIFYNQEISLPLYPLMKDKDVKDVVKRVNNVLTGALK